MDDLEELKPQNVKIEMDRWNISDLKDQLDQSNFEYLLRVHQR